MVTDTELATVTADIEKGAALQAITPNGLLDTLAYTNDDLLCLGEYINHIGKAAMYSAVDWLIKAQDSDLEQDVVDKYVERIGNSVGFKPATMLRNASTMRNFNAEHRAYDPYGHLTIGHYAEMVRHLDGPGMKSCLELLEMAAEHGWSRDYLAGKAFDLMLGAIPVSPTSNLPVTNNDDDAKNIAQWIEQHNTLCRQWANAHQVRTINVREDNRIVVLADTGAIVITSDTPLAIEIKETPT